MKPLLAVAIFGAAVIAMNLHTMAWGLPGGILLVCVNRMELKK